MNIRALLRASCRTAHALLLLPPLLASNAVFAANYPLKIIQPQPNLTTQNRFYKAYPGLEYNVRLAVTGGEYPYGFELLSGPGGMSIDERGQITWSNPVIAGSPHNVSVRVTDAAAAYATINWTITVTTSGFLFIDPINGKSTASGGTGTIQSPFRTMADVFKASKSDSTYAGQFLYWRDGEHILDGPTEDCGSPATCRIPLLGNAKPQVWLAYPGETPVFNLNTGGRDLFLVIYSGGNNTYFDGLTFNVNNNSRGMGVQIDSTASNVVFRRNTVYGLVGNRGGGNNSAFFVSNASAGQYYAFQDNVAYDINQAYWLLGYTAQNVLVENNSLTNVNTLPISPKTNTRGWTIRANTIKGATGDGIVVQYYSTSSDLEICYNLVQMKAGRALQLNREYNASGGPIFVYRNTFVGEVEANKVTSTNGPFSITRNVIINETSFPDKIARNSIDAAARLQVSDNLVGAATDNVVDSNGNLTAAYAAYLGTRGHLIGEQGTIRPPGGVQIYVTPAQD